MNKLKVGLIDADLLDNGTRHPNLVIMKISGYYKTQGYQVELIENYETLSENNYQKVKEYEKLFISKVFDFTKIDDKLLTFNNVYKGGTGFYYDKAPQLPEVIEHTKPDYSIYDQYILHDTKHKHIKNYWNDYKNYSIGFTTRGCFRKCAFCVNRNYDRVVFHSHVNEWLDINRPYIYLWDDNILAYSKWKEVFEELKETNKPFQFKQGMDIRLLTQEKAEVISKSKYHGDFIFAFDHLEDKDLIESKLQLWRSVTNRNTKLYVLAGYAAQDETEIESIFIRITTLMKYQCLPFIMKHENYLKSKYKGLILNIARWCNQPAFFKKKSFREFCELEQSKKIKPGLIASMKALVQFETDHPDIAAKYFDVKYEDFLIAM